MEEGPAIGTAAAVDGEGASTTPAGPPAPPQAVRLTDGEAASSSLEAEGADMEERPLREFIAAFRGRF